jgi:hypothetical protein
MSDYSFILDTMTWSFSRLESFYNCPYAWKRKYIDCEKGENNAFASYGTLCHSLLEQYLKGKLGAFDLAGEYEQRFDEEIPEEFPYNKYTDLRESYFYKGFNYFSEFVDLIDCDYEVLGVEKKVEFNIDKYQFVGYIDALLMDSDKNIIIMDQKSASLSWLKNGSPAKKSVEKMKMYERQLYLYSKALIDAGMTPKFLCWNFFNDGKIYKIQFDQNNYNETIKWALETISLIEKETEFEMKEEYYFCKNICDYRNNCFVNNTDDKNDGWVNNELRRDFNL